MLLPLILACSLLPDASSSPLPPARVQAEAVQVAKVHTKTITSSGYHIDKKYPSMRGPYGFDTVTLHEADKPELLWITGYRTTVVDAQTEGELSQEFMCHANLDFDPQEYYAKFPTAPPISGRLFTLSQGQQDIAFPKGFGIPVTSDMPITLATQVLNLNIDEADLSVKHKVEIDFVRDAEVQGAMVPLFQGAVEGFKALEEARYYGFSDTEVDPEDHGEGCGVGQAAIAGDADEDVLGQKFTAHWVVPPGEEVNVTNVTRFLNLPYDTRAHYIAVHLHPFAESLVLKDRTTGEIVFASTAEQTTGRIGLKRVEYYSDPEGIPLYKDHQYELVSKYNNTSEEAVDSMAVMYLYMHDRRFKKPVLVSQAE
jgi:hypothetical protein